MAPSILHIVLSMMQKKAPDRVRRGREAARVALLPRVKSRFPTEQLLKDQLSPSPHVKLSDLEMSQQHNRVSSWLPGACRQEMELMIRKLTRQEPGALGKGREQ